MKARFKKINLRLFAFIILIFSTLFIFHTDELYASESVDSTLIKKYLVHIPKNSATPLDLDCPRKAL